MDNIVPITPVNFFQLSFDCRYLPPSSQNGFALTSKNFDKYLVPDTSALTSEEHFAKIALGWNEEGIEAMAVIDQNYQGSFYPQVDRGDSLEIFIDTRDVKTSGYNTRFCHHFFCLAEGIEGRQTGELTKFRTEDVHELCNPNDLKCKALLKKNNYTLHFFIPSQCLYGYDPEQFNRIGFTYRINRGNGPSQHFSVVSEDYQVEQQPSLWSSVRLVR